MSPYNQESQEEFDDEDASGLEEEFEDENAEPEGSAVKNFLLSRRGLIIGVLAVAGASVAGYLTLREKGPGGTELMNEYDKIAAVEAADKKSELTDPKLRHMYVLKQVAARNMPSSYDDFVPIETKGQFGTIVRFKAAPHGLRIGHNDDWIEVPLDGPYAMAAAEILGYQLPTTWMVEAIAHQAIKFKKEKNGKEVAQDGNGKVKFIAAPEIAKALKIPWSPSKPDGWWQESPQFVRKRNELLHEWLKEHKVEEGQFISGYAKEICTPNLSKNKRMGFSSLFKRRDDKKQKVRLEFAGGYYEDGSLVQEPSGGKHTGNYFDYSHTVRFIESDQIEVQKKGETEFKTMTLSEFHNTKKFAEEFRFDMTKLLKRGYPYYPELAQWMEENGYLRSDYDAEDDKKEGAKDAGTKKGEEE